MQAKSSCVNGLTLVTQTLSELWQKGSKIKLELYTM